jgi:NADH-quinone oxidoreductase subunit C/D
MPAGPFKSDHPLTTPPRKDPGTLQHIETLIHHFLSVSWGPVIPPGEAHCRTEAPKGMYSFLLVSDGDTRSYRTRVRTPSFPHMQFVPEQARGLMVADLIAMLAATDFVLAEIDR